MTVTATVKWRATQATVRLASLVPVAVGYKVSAWTGDVLSITARSMRRRYDDSITAALPGRRKDLPSLRRRAFRNLAWNYFELFTLPRTSPEVLREWGSIDGLKAALAAAVKDGGSGAVIAFAHVGNIELLGHLGAHLPGERFAVVVEHMADERMDSLLNGLRCCHDLEVIPADEPRRILTTLRAGCHIILACDYDTTGRGILVEVFGRPVRLPIGAVRLAVGTGAALLWVEGWRDRMDDPSHVCARVVGPIDLTRTGRREEDVRAGVEALARLMERQVTEHPDQWLAFRDMWSAA